MCQAWSIVDVTVTNPGPGNFRFRNFLFPLRTFLDPTVGAHLPPFPEEILIDVETWFCSGHAWTPEGDLLVVGGSLATFDFGQYWESPLPTFPHPVLVGTGIGARRTFLFDPALPSQLYNDDGLWVDGPDMVENRWYATATTTQPMTRLPPSQDNLVMIAGGIDNTVPPSTPSTPENSYETYSIGPSAQLPSFLGIDPDPTPGTSVVYAGPDDPGTTNIVLEQLNTYPRLHVLSDNTVIHSGPGGRSAKVDQDVAAGPAPTHVRPWTSVDHSSSPIAFREDGSSVLMHTLGYDFVLRIGGDDPVTAPLGTPPVATDLVELCKANSPSPNWTPFGNLPGGARVFTNAVVLPDMSVLVLGGLASRVGTTYRDNPDLFRPGVGWQTVNAPSPTRRAYHTTAVLLPDGRVLVGGGELDTPQTSNERDYDIYIPHYLQGNPQRPGFFALTDASGALVTFDSVNSVDLLQRGQSFRARFDGIDELDQLEKIVLMAPGSITHHSDMSARYVDISGTAVDSFTRQFTIPANGAVPRGFYCSSDSTRRACLQWRGG